MNTDKLSSRNQPEPFQARVAPWMDETFGAMISGDKQERAHRFLEEAIELVQSTGTTASEAHQLVDYVFGRPAGETQQEVGGVMVTLAALCLAHALDMHVAGETELARVWTKVGQIRAKQAAKPKHSPLPGATQSTRQSAFLRDVLAERRRQVEVEGWTPEHDDQHAPHELSRAAACYCLTSEGLVNLPHDLWKLDDEWFKPGTARGDLVKAGALVLAEGEKLDRLKGAPL